MGLWLQVDYKKSFNKPGGWFVPLVVRRAHYYWVHQSRPPESACLSNGIALYKEVPNDFLDAVKERKPRGGFVSPKWHCPTIRFLIRLRALSGSSLFPCFQISYTIPPSQVLTVEFAIYLCFPLQLFSLLCGEKQSNCGQLASDFVAPPPLLDSLSQL